MSAKRIARLERALIALAATLELARARAETVAREVDAKHGKEWRRLEAEHEAWLRGEP